MIWDSSPWRKSLLAEARAFRRRAKSTKMTEKRSLLIERAVFIAAYTMRRLDDANKVSSKWRGSSIKCSQYAPSGEMPSPINWHHIEQFYDLSKPSACSIGARHFCDLIIHSLIFLEAVQDNKEIEGFFITSDQKAAQALWFFSVSAVAELIERSAVDDPDTIMLKRNDASGKWSIWRGNRETM